MSLQSNLQERNVFALRKCRRNKLNEFESPYLNHLMWGIGEVVPEKLKLEEKLLVRLCEVKPYCLIIV